jgi:transcriptional regulator with XRE-family HTH domain
MNPTEPELADQDVPASKHEPESDSIGARVRSCRNFRGMSLETLAGLSGVSPSFLSMVENGLRSLNNRHHVAAIADALKVSVTDLTGQPYSPGNDKIMAGLHSGLAVIRDTLARRSLYFPEGTGARPVSVLKEETEKIAKLRQAGKLAEAVQQLPGILDELHEAFARRDRRQEVAEVIMVALHDTRSIAKSTGHHALALLAAERERDAAEATEDPVWIAFADRARAKNLFPLGGFRRAHALCLRAADELDRTGPSGVALEMYGMLHLTAALAQTSVSGPSGGTDHLDEATAIAQRTGEAHSLRMWFGPTNVAMWRMAVVVESGDGGRAAEIAQSIDPRIIPSRARQAGFYAELGRGLAQDRKNDRAALQALRKAEDLSPQEIRSNPLVRDVISSMLTRARREAGGRELRGMAYRMGIPH